MSKVVITRTIPKNGIQILKDNGYILDYHDRFDPLPPDLLRQKCQDADALLCLLDDTIDGELIQSSPKLQIISNYAVGYNNIDLEAAKQAGITVTNTPGVLTNATADLAFGLLLAVARRIVEADQYIRNRKEQGRFEGWQSTMLLGAEMTGSTLGILGAGRIGTAMAKRGLGFGMKIIYHARTSKSELDTLGCSFVNLDTIIQTSDFLSVHLPLTEETEHLLDRNRLEQMKSGAYLINTGRGRLIDESALVSVLQSGKLAGAALDVYEDEPKIHPGLYELDNVVLVPHIGSATTYARETMSRLAAEAIVAVLDGDEPNHRVV